MEKYPQKPVCVGRLLVDVPVVMSKKYFGSTYYQGFQIETTPVIDTTTVNAIVAKEESRLKLEKHNTENTLYIATQNLNANDKLITSYHNALSTRTTVYQAYFFRADNLYAFKADVSKDHLISALDDLKNIASSLAPRKMDEIPKDEGYCIQDAFIKSNQTGQEYTSLGSRAWDGDLQLTVDTRYLPKDSKPEESLSKRVGAATKIAGSLLDGLKTLRSGKKKAGTFDGEEYAYKGGKQESERYVFTWEFAGVPGKLDKPVVSIELRATEDALKQISEDELIAMWDAILATVRQRTQ